MKAIGNKIGVVFDDSHLKTYNLGGIILHRAESWVGKEGNEESHTKIQSNVNHLETNPQIGWIEMSNENYDLKKGDKVFIHYLAYEEFEEKLEADGKDIYLIDANYIFFVIGDEIKMRPNTYLGEVIFEEPPKSSFGIYLTSQEALKNDLRVKITHAPISFVNEHGVEVKNVCEIGDEVIPIDRSNYPIKIDGKEYVMLRDTEIIGCYEENGKTA